MLEKDSLHLECAKHILAEGPATGPELFQNVALYTNSDIIDVRTIMASLVSRGELTLNANLTFSLPRTQQV